MHIHTSIIHLNPISTETGQEGNSGDDSWTDHFLERRRQHFSFLPLLGDVVGEVCTFCFFQLYPFYFPFPVTRRRSRTVPRVRPSLSDRSHPGRDDRRTTGGEGGRPTLRHGLWAPPAVRAFRVFSVTQRHLCSYIRVNYTKYINM